jgi:uncharacterized 2Fe-2S/4Fe-4S cluster protein (DUF4445 family)
VTDKETLLALDLGTTTLAGRLIDRDGRTLAEATERNPQAQLGADIVRRLELAHNGQGEQLQRLLVEGLERLIGTLLISAGTDRQTIASAAAAGNSGICALLRGQSVERLLFPPHRPRETQGLYLDVQALGFNLPVPLYLFPLVTGYVGGDLVAFLLSQAPYGNNTLYLDIGTNGELALHSNARWWTTSVAAGPAFEGGGISCGMAAALGAVSGVTLDGDRLRLEVIGGGVPRGLCGSGLAETVAAALEGGLIDCHGTLADPLQVPSNLARYLDGGSGKRCLRLYRDASVDLCLTQEDLRTFQLAKGAIRAGVDCLLARAGLSADSIAEVVVTGAFGFSLALRILKRVALLPENMIDRVRFAEAGVLAGCCRLLLDEAGPEKAQLLADALTPYPLSGTPAFEKAFLSALDF